MKKYVLDTQVLIKFIHGKRVINKNISLILRRIDEGKDIAIIPSAIIFEIGYRHERGRIPISLDDIQNILDNSINYVEEKLTLAIIRTAFEIKDIPELHDRLIAGTARYLNIPLITNDPVILRSKFLKCVK